MEDIIKLYRYRFSWTLINLKTNDLEAGSKEILERNSVKAYERFKETKEFTAIKEMTPYADNFLNIKLKKYSTPDELIKVKKIA